MEVRKEGSCFLELKLSFVLVIFLFIDCTFMVFKIRICKSLKGLLVNDSA